MTPSQATRSRRAINDSRSIETKLVVRNPALVTTPNSQNLIIGAPTLPPEILNIILGYATVPKYDVYLWSPEAAYKILLAGALVCRSWRDVFQRDLCHKVWLDVPGSIESFVEAKVMDMQYPIFELLVFTPDHAPRPVNEIIEKANRLWQLTLECNGLIMNKKAIKVLKGLLEWNFRLYPSLDIATASSRLFLPYLKRLKVFAFCNISHLLQLALYCKFPAVEQVEIHFSQKDDTTPGVLKAFLVKFIRRNGSQLESLVLDNFRLRSRRHSDEVAEALIDTLPRAKALKIFTLNFIEGEYIDDLQVFPFDEVLASIVASSPTEIKLCEFEMTITMWYHGALNDFHRRLNLMLNDPKRYLIGVGSLTFTCLMGELNEFARYEKFDIEKQFIEVCRKYRNLGVSLYVVIEMPNPYAEEEYDMGD